MATYVPLKEAAAHFRVDPETLREGIADGVLPGAIRIGRVWRIDVDVLGEHFRNAANNPTVSPRVTRLRAGRRPRAAG